MMKRAITYGLTGILSIGLMSGIATAQVVNTPYMDQPRAEFRYDEERFNRDEMMMMEDDSGRQMGMDDRSRRSIGMDSRYQQEMDQRYRQQTGMDDSYQQRRMEDRSRQRMGMDDRYQQRRMDQRYRQQTGMDDGYQQRRMDNRSRQQMGMDDRYQQRMRRDTYRSGRMQMQQRGQSQARGYFDPLEQNPLVEESSKSGIDFISGGVGVEQRDTINAVEEEYSLKTVFADQTGRYVADIDLDITDSNGQQVFSLNSAGPWVLTALPSGQYRVTATYEGQTKTRTIRINENSLRTVMFNWDLM